MKYCSHCGATLLANARFCHECGTEVAAVRPTICAACAQPNPVQAKFCVACGHQLGAAVEAEEQAQEMSRAARFRLDFQDWTTFPTQIKQHFMAYLAEALAQDGEEKRLGQYVAAFERSGFRQKVFEERALALTTQAEQLIATAPLTAIYDIDALLAQNFAAAYLEFLVEYAQDISPAPLSKLVLLHEKNKNIRISALIHDYLDLPQERDITAYRQMLEIPLPKLKNAQNSFFNPTRSGEYPLVFIDQTIWGSGNDGLILSEFALYWKTAFHSAARVAYADLHSIVRKDKYLEINNIYLNVTPTVNFKLLKLLQKLQHITH